MSFYLYISAYMKSVLKSFLKCVCVCRDNLGQWEKIVQGEEPSAGVPSEEHEPSELSESGPVKVDN